uniref:ATP-dependent DNA helicase n=1 Tax=Meloidogyne javanica TaxID=6303 RepID=A0A915MB81_MELJA
MAEILKNSYEFYKDIEQNSPENLKNFKVILVEDKNAPAAIQDPNLHPRQVNLPTHDESTVFAIWSSNTDEPPPLRGIWITKKGNVTDLWTNHPMTDSILYPCMFLLGDEGYSKDIPYIKVARKPNNAKDDFDTDKSETGSIAESDCGSVDIYGDEPSRSRPNLSFRAFYRYRFGISQAAAIAAGLPGNLPKTMLTEYWSQWKQGKSWQYINKKWKLEDDASITTTLYEHMPENYWFDKNGKIWKKRINNKDVIGLIHPRPYPRDQEKFALYILLRHFPGDPEALKDVNGVMCTSFVESARLRGLLSDDSMWERTLEEASHFSTPSAMRYLFVQVLVFGNPSNARELWERFVDHMFKPIIGNDPNGIERNRRIDRVLAIIEAQLSDYGMTNQQFGLDSPSPGMRQDVDEALDNFFFGDKDEDDFASGNKPKIKLNDDQENVWTAVQNAINGTSSNTIFVTGDGGTGKTYLFNAVISRLRDMRIRVIASAYTGCAATLLTGGATVHSCQCKAITEGESETVKL